jgi:hypothetical protein
VEYALGSGGTALARRLPFTALTPHGHRRDAHDEPLYRHAQVMRTLVLIGRWLLVAVGVAAWIAIVPLVDLLVSRLGSGDRATTKPIDDRAKAAQLFPRAV